MNSSHDSIRPSVQVPGLARANTGNARPFMIDVEM